MTTPNEAMALAAGPCENTDRELWRETPSYYSDSIHVTQEGGIGINCGGHIFVKPLREWHRLATLACAPPDAAALREQRQEPRERLAQIRDKLGEPCRLLFSELDNGVHIETQLPSALIDSPLLYGRVALTLCDADAKLIRALGDGSYPAAPTAAAPKVEPDRTRETECADCGAVGSIVHHLGCECLLSDEDFAAQCVAERAEHAPAAEPVAPLSAEDWRDIANGREAAPVALTPEADDLMRDIEEAQARIGKMCSEGRPPKMSIPVRESDDDVFITGTLRRAAAALSAARSELERKQQTIGRISDYLDDAIADRNKAEAERDAARELLEKCSDALIVCTHPGAAGMNASDCEYCQLRMTVDAYLRDRGTDNG